MRGVVRGLGIALLLSFAVVDSARAEEVRRGLDEQVQEIKSDVLAIAAELRQLEEKLLYPSHTQVAVFVSIAEGDLLELDSVQIQIDGAPATRHVYSFKELSALRKGGVQRIYTGNLPTGEHRIEVSMAGTLPGGARFDETEEFPFRKDVEPKVVSLTLAGKSAGKSAGGPGIRLGSR